jgi:hypothetical protein
MKQYTRLGSTRGRDSGPAYIDCVESQGRTDHLDHQDWEKQHKAVSW